MLRSLLLLSALCVTCSAQVFTVIVPKAPTKEDPQSVNIEIPAGKIAEFIGLMGDSNFSLLLGDMQLSRFRDATVTAYNPLTPIVLAGPLTVTLKSYNTYNGGVCTYRLSDNVASAAPSVESHTPSNAVVIPANASGNVQVILESSIDMVTWTAANPGTYSSSTEKRFFRVRAVAP